MVVGDLMLQHLVQETFLHMASVSINAPSSDCTITNYANVTGLSVLTATTSSSTSSTVSLDWIDNPLGYNDGNSDRRNGGWIPRIPSDTSFIMNDGTIYAGGTYCSIHIGTTQGGPGLTPYMTQAHVTELFGSSGSNLSISGTAPHGIGAFYNSTTNSMLCMYVYMYIHMHMYEDLQTLYMQMNV